MPGSLSFENMRGLFNRDGYFFQQTLGRQLLTEPHSHDFYEMICLLSGSCVHIVNGFEVNCSEGDVFLLRPCDVHSFRDQGDGTNIAALSVAEPEVEQFITAYGFENDAVFDRQETPTEVPRTIVRRIERQGFSELCDSVFTIPESRQTPLCRVLLGEFFGRYIKDRAGIDSVMPPSFSAILAEMNHLPNAAEGVSAFLRLSNFSHAQLCRLTKKYLGMTPGEYINSVRMKYAYEMVMSGEKDYETICEEIGFSSYTYFCRLFEKTYGATPAKTRNSYYSGCQTI